MSATAGTTGYEGKSTALVLLAVCELAAISLWFSLTVSVPSLVREYPLSNVQVSLLTSMAQGGFVVGTLVSAILGLADRLEKLAALHERGVLTDAEFAKAKALQLGL